MNRKARTTAALGVSGTSSALPSKVSLLTGVQAQLDGGMLNSDAAVWGKGMGWRHSKAKGLLAWAVLNPVSACSPGLFASVSKVSKAVDAPPSSVTSTPRTPRMDFSRVTGKGRREHKGQQCGVRWVGRVGLGDTVGGSVSMVLFFLNSSCRE